MRKALAHLDVQDYKPHALHGFHRDWPETNCYTDLWIEALNALDLPPEAMLGFTVRQDFEGDQFTFFKTPLEDLETLYDICVGELAIFDDLETHIEIQIARGRLVLVEVDAFFLPDTREVSYRSAHSKTTIGVNAIDPANRWMGYFHNAGYFVIEGEDYDGIFAMFRRARQGGQLFPYAEFAKFPQRPRMPTRATCEQLLAAHLQRRPTQNPFRAWQKALPEQIEELVGRPESYFHVYAFNTLRQTGANFELLASHLEWLSPNVFGKEIEAARSISRSAKAMQFQLARALARRKYADLADSIGPMADAWDTIMQGLDARTELRRAA